MNEIKQQIQKQIEQQKAYVDGALVTPIKFESIDLIGIDFSNINIQDANFINCNIQDCIFNFAKGANFSGSKLYSCNFKEANLINARFIKTIQKNNLFENANLNNTCFEKAEIYNSSFYCANISNSSFYSSCLNDGTNLICSNVNRTCFINANLKGCNIGAPTGMLLASWGTLSKKLCQKAMAYDAANHHDKSRFDYWKKTGLCPFKNLNYTRSCNFDERIFWWDPEITAPSALELVIEIIKEKCISSDWH